MNINLSPVDLILSAFFVLILFALGYVTRAIQESEIFRTEKKNDCYPRKKII